MSKEDGSIQPGDKVQIEKSAGTHVDVNPSGKRFGTHSWYVPCKGEQPEIRVLSQAPGEDSRFQLKVASLGFRVKSVHVKDLRRVRE